MRRVVVHQMGKVASSALTDLAIQGLGIPVPQTHLLCREALAEVMHRYRANSKLPPPHVNRSHLVLDWLAAGDSIDFITVVREPFSRNLSAFFQNIDFFIDAPHQASAKDIAATFLNRYPHQVPIEWFDQQVRNPIGIDVYAQPFDVAQGYSVITTVRHRLLIMRYESSSNLKRQLMSQFLGVELPTLGWVNTTSAKKSGMQYSAVKRDLRFPAEFVRDILKSRYCAHFYSAAERDQMWARWVEGRPAGF